MRSRSNPKSGSKNVTSDLIARLGYLSVKSQEPSACKIDEFAVEQFFANYQRTDLFCVMTADHIEHGFNALAKASKIEGLEQLTAILEHIFIFAFCNIIVNDGTERAQLFLDRQSKFTSFPPKFIKTIGSLQPKDIDNFPEFSEFISNPSIIEFDPEFYHNLNSFIQKNPIPGSIYLLKHFLHNEIPVNSPITYSTTKDNRPIELNYRSECLTIPFHESNVPQLIQRSQQYSEFKISRQITGLMMKRPTTKPPHIPSLTSITVPRHASTAAMDPKSSAICYSELNSIYYVSPDNAVTKLRSHSHSITALSFSSCGKFILSGDCCGDVMVQSVNGKKHFVYQSIPETITTVTFYNRIFAVGTLSGSIYIYETNSKDVLRILLFHKSNDPQVTSAITFMSIHPNCEYIASVSMDNTIRICSITQAVCVRLWKCPTKIAMSARFSHDGKLLIVSCSEGCLYIYDIGSTKITRTIPIEAPLIDAIFSPNDQLIAIVDKTGGFSLWDSVDLTADNLIVLQIDKIKPINISFLEGDEVRVIGNLMPNKYFEDAFR
ncbi:hypothetical protein TRFO_03350 [Tritrichomonas foetus]|uniref:Anaphase-promoting complex subunit 4 WD40 domain-containing protein n=1 Tax=Tritrichomonas foetus TaxID=1144522 RepID=A0A1J4KQM7_9EUKA|nr:hypothetical protein TRFO_03350 [Tritrichomonas foetus]|eukprot:OHT13585.1 hypothetical protein TRFO_03350 [Tritrichomonas foetus]